jgi:hypothetical protein
MKRTALGTTAIGLLACALALLAPAFKAAAASYSIDDFKGLDKIDVHVHINSADNALIDQARADGFRLLTINVDYPDFPPLAEQLQIAEAHAAENPATVAFAASFSMRGWDDPGWQQRVIHELDAAFTAGAVAVKVWKNIGMDFRDANGRLVMIDDPRFDPVFDFIRRRHRVLIGHQGEPHNCWLPISEMTVNNDREYFRDHPQYHMFLHPELPSYEQQMAARDRMLAKNPGLKFMGAHLASLEWSVERLAQFLDRFPNAVVDLAARMGQVQYQSNRDRDKVRRFFIRYQDRLLYGTDVEQEPGGDSLALRRDVHATWLRDWRYLNTDETMSVPELDAPVRGLRLPKNVIRKIYSSNALRWFGKPWAAAAPRTTTESK